MTEALAAETSSRSWRWASGEHDRIADRVVFVSLRPAVLRSLEGEMQAVAQRHP